MAEHPLAQRGEVGGGEGSFTRGDARLEVAHLVHQLVVLGRVGRQSGIGLLAHHQLLANEMDVGELDQPVEQRGELRLVGSPAQLRLDRQQEIDLALMFEVAAPLSVAIQ